MTKNVYTGRIGSRDEEVGLRSLRPVPRSLLDSTLCPRPCLQLHITKKYKCLQPSHVPYLLSPLIYCLCLNTLDAGEIVCVVRDSKPTTVLTCSSSEAEICLAIIETRVVLFLPIPRHHYQQNKQQVIKWEAKVLVAQAALGHVQFRQSWSALHITKTN